MLFHENKAYNYKHNTFLYIIELPQKMSKKEYFKKIRLLLKTLTIVADQIIDIILVATLFLLQEHWFVNL